jgi:hypothetical protein
MDEFHKAMVRQSVWKAIALTLIAVFVLSLVQPEPAEGLFGAGDVVFVSNFSMLTAVQQAFTKVLVQTELIANKLMQWKVWLEKLKALQAIDGIFASFNPQEFFLNNMMQINYEFLSKIHEVLDVNRQLGTMIPTRGVSSTQWHAVAESDTDYQMPVTNGSSSMPDYDERVSKNAQFEGGKPIGVDRIEGSEVFREKSEGERKEFRYKVKYLDNANRAIADRIATGGALVKIADRTIEKLNSFDLTQLDSASYTSYMAMKALVREMHINNVLLAQYLKVKGKDLMQDANIRATDVRRYETEVLEMVVE